MKVLFPTPGEPVIPTLIEVPECDDMDSRRLLAISMSEVLELSTSVIAFDVQVLSPERTPVDMSSSSLSSMIIQSISEGLTQHQR